MALKWQRRRTLQMQPLHPRWQGSRTLLSVVFTMLYLCDVNQQLPRRGAEASMALKSILPLDPWEQGVPRCPGRAPSWCRSCSPRRGCQLHPDHWSTHGCLSAALQMLMGDTTIGLFYYNMIITIKWHPTFFRNVTFTQDFIFWLPHLQIDSANAMSLSHPISFSWQKLTFSSPWRGF